jgi:hypothetical protein
MVAQLLPEFLKLRGASAGSEFLEATASLAGHSPKPTAVGSRPTQHRGQVRAGTSYLRVPVSGGREPVARFGGLLDLGRPGVAAFASGIGLRALDELIA